MGEMGRFCHLLMVFLLIISFSFRSTIANGMDSRDEDQEALTRLGEDPPSPPLNLRYTEEAHRITLRWDPPSDWGDWTEWRGYHVYYEDDYGNPHTADLIKDPEQTHTHKMVRYDWKYWVAAETDINRSQYSGPIIPKDHLGPWAEVLSYPLKMVFGKDYTISVAVHEVNGLNRVILEFRDGNDSILFNRSMVHVGGDTYGEYFSRNVSLNNTISNASFRIVTCDSAGNWNSTGLFSVSTIEYDLPLLLYDNTTSSVREGDILEFDIEGWDESGLKQVEILYWRGTEEANSVTLDSTEGLRFTGSIEVGKDIRPIHYSIRLEDIYGNTFTTSDFRTVTVIDSTPPIILDNWVSGVPGTGENLTFNVNVTDNGPMDLARFYYRFDNSSVFEVTVFEWSYSFFIDPSARNITYSWEVMDRAGNRNATNETTLGIRDLIPPSIEIISETVEPTTGDPFNMEVEARDNWNVSNVTFYYRFGENSPVKIKWIYDTGSGYEVSLDLPIDYDGILEYWFSVEDTSGNVFNMSIEQKDIIDNDPPYIQIIEDQSGLVGEPFELNIVYNDNIGVTYVEWKDSPVISNTDRIYFTPIFPIHQTVSVTVYDKEGNFHTRQFILHVTGDQTDGSFPSGGSGSDSDPNGDQEMIGVCCGSFFIIIIFLIILVNIFKKKTKPASEKLEPRAPIPMPAARGKGIDKGEMEIDQLDDPGSVATDTVDRDKGADLYIGDRFNEIPIEEEDQSDLLGIIEDEEILQYMPVHDSGGPRILDPPGTNGPRVLAPPPGFEE